MVDTIQAITSKFFKGFYFLVPKNCNFNCAFCGVKKSDKKKKIDFSIISNLLLLAKKNKIKNVVLTGGGEPSLCFNDILKILKLAKKNRIGTTLTTNCSFMMNKKIKEPIKKLKDAGLCRISISSDYDHSKFIPHEFIVSTINKALNSGIKIKLSMVNRKGTEKNNLEILKTICNDLNARLVKVIPTGIGERDVGIYMIIKNKKIIILDIARNPLPTKENYKFLKAEKLNYKNLAFKCCNYDCLSHPIIDSNYNILPCVSYNAQNMPNIYSMEKVTKSSKNIYGVPNKLLKNILLNRFTFLSIYLKIQKDENLKRKFLKEKFFCECDFCSWILEHKYEIKKIKDTPHIEMLLFTLLNFRIFLKEYLSHLELIFWNFFCEMSIYFLKSLFKS